MACYKVKVTKVEDEDDQVWEFTQWWVKGYGVQTGSLHWSDSDDTLYIGFDDGSVQRLKISNIGSATELPEFRNQSDRITGMVALPEANKLIAVSDIGSLIVSELTSSEEIQTLYPVYPYRYALKCLLNMPTRNAIAASDYSGRIFIWSHDPSVQLIIQLDPASKSEIKGLQVINNLLCAGQVDGQVTLYDMGPPGKEKFTKVLTTWQGKPGVRLICMRDKPRREILTGDNTGIITVWDLKTQQPVYVL